MNKAASLQLHFWELKFYFICLLFPHNCFKTDKPFLSRSKPKLRAGAGRDPWECGCRPARRRELGDKARSCQAGVPCPPAGDHDRDYARGEGHPPGHVQRTAAAVTDAELATYIARSAQGSRGAPHSGSLWGLRRNRGLHAESQRRFYGYLFSTDSNCRSLLTAP